MRRMVLGVLGLALFQIAFGAFTRGSGSGFGCRDRWPLCDGGALGGWLPRLEPAMLIEWSHRWIALLVAAGVVALAIVAWRGRHSWLRWAGAAVVVVGAQALLGAAVVLDYGNADLVTAHLVGALALLAILTHLSVLIGRAEWHGAPDRRWTRRYVAATAGMFVTLVLGSSVHDLYVGGWPLVADRVVPPLGITPEVDRHIGHRLAAGVMLAALIWLAQQARRRPLAERRLVVATLALHVGNVGLGAVHVVTEVSSTVAIVAHLTIGAAAWITLVAARSHASHRAAIPQSLSVTTQGVSV